MTKINIAVIALASVSALALSGTSQAAMNPYMKTALVDVCKAAMSNKIHRLNSTTNAYRLRDKTVALKVMCNGDDIISFAESSPEPNPLEAEKYVLAENDPYVLATNGGGK